MTDQIATQAPAEGRGAHTDPAKRRQILAGAARVFLAQGFDAASMATIAREAGVSKGTLYVYFESKEDLFEAIVEGQCLAQAEQIFTFDEDADISAELTRMGEGYVRYKCHQADLSSVRTIMAIAERMPEVGARFYQAGPARGVASLKRYLEAKVAAGVLEPHDCEVAASQFIDACVATMLRPMLFNAGRPPSDERIRHVVAMAVRMLLSTYGRGGAGQRSG